MQLYFMRHGDALWDTYVDEQRNLSTIGHQQIQDMSDWLSQQIAGFDLVLISPYLRVNQTWLEVEPYFTKPKHFFVIDDLTPSTEPKFAKEVILAYTEQYQANSVLIISHMPLLSYLVAEFVVGEEPPLFSPSSLCLVEYNSRVGEKIYFQMSETLAAESASKMVS